jgi:hypothetical protein
LKGGVILAIKRKNSKGEWIVDQRAVDTTIMDLEGNFESSNVEGALRELANKSDEVKYSAVPPTDDDTLIWVDTSADKGASSLLVDSLILEFKKTIEHMNLQIERLRADNVALEQRVAYLELHGGGSGGSGGGVIESGVQLVFEDGSIMTFEDGSIMTFEDVETNTGTKMTFEDDSVMTFEDNAEMIFED